MKRLDFLVEGSKGDEYHVVFERNGTNLNIFCSCKAGQNGLYCKHRFALMDGVIDDLISDNEDEASEIKDIISGTDVEIAYQKALQLEEAHAEIKRQLDEAKRDLAEAMRA